MIEVIVGALISLVIGIYCGWKFSQRKSATYLLKKRNVLEPVENKFPRGVVITFNDVPVTKLVEWKLFVWNSGNQTIDGNEIVKELSLKLENGTLVGEPSVSASRSEIDASATMGVDEFKVSFNFLDRRDTIGVTFYTDSDDLETPKARFEGAIKGIPYGLSQSKEDDPVLIKDQLAYTGIGFLFALLTVMFAIQFVEYGRVLGLWALQTGSTASQDFISSEPILNWLGIVFTLAAGSFCFAMCITGFVLTLANVGRHPQFVRNNLGS